MTSPTSPSSSAAVRQAADRWFLDRGLPAVLRPGALVRRVWPRSAPALAALAVFMVNSIVVVVLTGKHTINIDGQPTRTEWFVLALLALVLPVAATVGWLVSRIGSTQARSLAATVSVVAAVTGALLGGPSPRVLPDVILVGLLIAGVVAVTASGAGSILAWSVRMTLQHLAMAGSLFVRALPVLLLTVVVFFNGYVWLMAATISRPRLWLAMLFLGLIAVAFIMSATVERVRPILSAPAAPGDDDSLAGTPFEKMVDPACGTRLARIERWNVMLVLAISQVVQVLLVSAVTALIFFGLGLILLSPELLAEWTHNGSSDGKFLGMTLPVPQALIQISLFLGGLTFMYISARAAGDADYRSRYFDPLLDDLRFTLTARNRYRAYAAASR